MDTNIFEVCMPHGDANSEYKEICNDFSCTIQESFPGDLVAYAYLSGTFAYRGSTKGKSDIDVTIVFKNNSYLMDLAYIHKQVGTFIMKYHMIHKQYGYISDAVFPGEYITVAQVQDAISGRGFSVNKNKKLFLPEASNEYYLSNKEYWFRAWLSSIAFSSFLYGNKDLMLQHKNKAWKTVILFLLSQYTPPLISGGTLIERMLENENKWGGVGVTNRYTLFLEQELPIVEIILKDLKEEGFLIEKESHTYEVVTLKVTNWEQKIVSSLLDKRVQKSAILFGS